MAEKRLAPPFLLRTAGAYALLVVDNDDFLLGRQVTGLTACLFVLAFIYLGMAAVDQRHLAQPVE